jgi:hypothetical protein
MVAYGVLTAAKTSKNQPFTDDFSTHSFAARAGL